jgi:beta-lactamase regulating signal transducer with metallopeptidase domain
MDRIERALSETGNEFNSNPGWKERVMLQVDREMKEQARRRQHRRIIGAFTALVIAIVVACLALARHYDQETKRIREQMKLEDERMRRFDDRIDP